MVSLQNKKFDYILSNGRSKASANLPKSSCRIGCTDLTFVGEYIPANMELLDCKSAPINASKVSEFNRLRITLSCKREMKIIKV